MHPSSSSPSTFLPQLAHTLQLFLVSVRSLITRTLLLFVFLSLSSSLSSTLTLTLTLTLILRGVFSFCLSPL